jgi:TM2 domain-containing membrane protein YozV
MALSYGSSIVRDGLFLHYDFANIKTYSGTGNTIYDLSGNNKNATKGQYRFFTNQSGGELVSQGISGSDPISISGIFGNYYTTDLTVSFWMDLQTTAIQDLVTQYSGSLGWLISVNANKQFYVHGRDGVSAYFISTPSTTILRQGIIYNLVFTKSGNVWKLFINGEEEISNVLGISTNVNSNINLVIGGSIGFPHSLFDFKMYSRALSSQEVEQNYNALKGRFITEIDSDLIIDLNPNDTRSYSGSGTSFIDISANSNTALMINGPIFGSDGYTNYWKFDGVNDYASVSATPTVFNYNRNSFTISCWAWYDVLESPIYKSGLLSKWQVGGGTNNEFLFIVNGSSSTNNYYYMQLDYDDGLPADLGNNATITSTSKVNLKFWRLATFTFDNGVLKMYIDGNLETTLVSTNTKVKRDTSSYLEIARWFQSSPIYGSGRRGQIQFYNRALTSTEILNLFNSQRQKYRLLNPSYMKNCVFNFDFGIEGTFDNSGTTVNDLARYNHGTTFNSPTYTFENRGAMVFNGTNQYIQIANNSVFNHTSGYFSFALWVNFSNVTGQRCIFTNYAGSTSGWSIQLFGGVINIFLSGDGPDIVGTTPIQLSTWYHIFVTGSPGSYKLYINGIREGIIFTGAVALTGSNIFVSQIAGGANFAGKIALIQMFNAQFSEADVRSHYSETLSRFTTSEKPVRGLIFDVNVSNPFSYNGASNSTGANLSDISGNGYVGTLSNAPSYNVQNGIKSLSFNGSNNYISYPTAGLPYGASARTISVWLNPSSLSQGWAISYGNATGSQSNFIGIISGVLNYGGFSNDLFGPAPSINTWYHVVGVYDGTTAYMYINGYLYTSAAKTWNTVQVSFQLGRQTTNSEYWHGKIGEAQIYNRALSATEIVALYNSTKGAYGF